MTGKFYLFLLLALANAGNGNIRAYYNWDNFGNQNSIKDNYVIGGLSSSATAITGIKQNKTFGLE